MQDDEASPSSTNDYADGGSAPLAGHKPRFAPGGRGRRRRLVLVHGPWQLLMATSALLQASGSGESFDSTLMFFALHDGPLPAPLLEVMKRIAAAVWPWKEIVVADGVDRWQLADSRACIDKVRELVPNGSPDEIWLDCLWGSPQKLAAEAFPAAKLVLYEDGLQTYLPHEGHHADFVRLLRDPVGFYRAVKLRAREWRNSGDLSLATMLPRHIGRVSASYLWISLMVRPPIHQKNLRWTQIETSNVKETIARATTAVDDVGLPRGGRRALVLGQCFSNYGDLPWDAELASYVGMARGLQDLGYEVVWKEHPRARTSFFLELSEAAPGVRSAPDWGPWPAELLVERLGLSACAAITSTSLFSMPLLFGLESFSSAGSVASLLRFPNDGLARLVSNHVKPLDRTTVAAGPAVAPTERSVSSRASRREAPRTPKGRLIS